MVHTSSSKFKKVNETYNSKQDSIESCFFEYLMIKFLQIYYWSIYMKEKIKYVILIILLILIVISMYIIANAKPKNKGEEPERIAVNKIVCYSSANAINSSENIKENWEVDIYQYTDIAIYLQKIRNIEIASVYLDNIEINKKPTLGEANIYRKNIDDFAKNMLLETAEDKIELKVSLDGENDFLQNCTSPITISYINKNIKRNYLIPNTSQQLTFDETILKRAMILSEEIEAQISFDINIIDSEQNKYIAKITLDIPIKEMMNGQNTVEIDNYIPFSREENEINEQ